MKKNYKEGTLFAIPLSDSVFGIGLIARMNGSILLCYFLKRKLDNMPSIEFATSMFTEVDANYLIELVGSLGLDKKEWVILGELNDWDRKFWPVPVFKRKLLLTEKYNLVYSDENLQNPKEKLVNYSNELDSLPNDGISGYVLLEKKLAKI